MKHGTEGNKLKIVTMILISFLLIMTLATVNDAQTLTRQSLPVYNVDSDSYYNTIQEAIDAASSGDTLEVSPGIYYENILIDRTLKLIGANQTSTIIDGSGNGTVVLITEDNVNITEFTLRNSGPDIDNAGIHILGAKNSSISNTILTLNEVGAYVSSTFSSGDSSSNMIFDRPGDYPLINNQGQATWRGWSLGSNYLSVTEQIYFWDGAEVIQLTNYSDNNVENPQINDNGQIVWVWGTDDFHSEIYLWDGNEIIQVTDNIIMEYEPVINNKGEIAWFQDDGHVYYWDGTDITCISNGSIGGQRLQINDNGWVVWKGDVEQYHTDIFCWNNQTVIQIQNDTAYEWYPQLNNKNQIGWISDQGIHIWENGTITKISDPGDMFSARMNEIGQMVWLDSDMGDVMFWDGTQVIQVTDNGNADRPAINNLGHLTWHGFHNGNIYYWDGNTVSILTDDDNLGRDARINDHDQVIWTSICNEVYSIYLWGGGNITADYANDNSIFNNTITENEHGIRIETAYNNQIYHNLFLNNSNQSFCQQFNDWDLGYPKGGNFWSDYDGSDDYSGPNQDIPGKDGIGDIPYTIFGGGYVDHYPLMSTADAPAVITPPVESPVDNPLNPPADPTIDPAGISWMPILVGSALGLSLALGMSLEIIGYSLLVALLTLYSKIKREDVLDQYLRGKIHGYIIANPGEHYNGIKKALKINNGSLAHHLSILEKEELVKSRNDGAFKRFFPYNHQIGDDEIQSNTRAQIQNHILNNPGITQKQLASRLGISPSTVNYHIKNLEKDEMISTMKKGFNVKYYGKNT